jgi:hypothetical protein
MISQQTWGDKTGPNSAGAELQKRLGQDDSTKYSVLSVWRFAVGSLFSPLALSLVSLVSVAHERDECCSDRSCCVSQLRPFRCALQGADEESRSTHPSQGTCIPPTSRHAFAASDSVWLDSKELAIDDKPCGACTELLALKTEQQTLKQEKAKNAELLLQSQSFKASLREEMDAYRAEHKLEVAAYRAEHKLEMQALNTELNATKLDLNATKLELHKANARIVVLETKTEAVIS